MIKKDMFKVLCKSNRDSVIELSHIIEKNHNIIVVKKPAKTLVMVKMKEPVTSAEYFLGELLACEAMVSINGIKGMALTMGDDMEKVLAMSIVDAAMNAKLPETIWLEEKLFEMKKEVEKAERLEFGRNIKSKVSFNLMEGS